MLLVYVRSISDPHQNVGDSAVADRWLTHSEPRLGAHALRLSVKPLKEDIA